MIYIYDRNEKQIAHLDIIPKITEEIGKLRVLEFESEQEFEKGFRVVADNEDRKSEFIIREVDYEREETKVFSYFCQCSFIENESVPILDKRPTGDISTALTPVFSDTRWIFEVRSTDTINQNYNNSFYHINALEAFAETVEKYKVEWITEFKYVGSKITERRVVIYRRDGRSKGRLEFGKNIKKFSRKILSEPIVTALYPYGKGEDLGNGSYGRRIGIESVNNGIPYIENKQATELYGIGEKGSKKPLFAFITFDEETDPTNLKKEAQKELDILSQIRAEHIVEAIDLDIDAKIGYEVAVIDEEIGYRGYSRIIKLVRQGDDVEVTFGQVTKTFTDTFQKTLKKTEQGLVEVFEQVNNIKISADGKTDVFTGATKPVNANEGDLWYRYNADGTVDLLNFVNGEWKEELSEKIFKEIKDSIIENKELIETAKAKADEASKSLQNILPIIDENTKIRQDLNGETGNTSLTTIRQSLDSFVSQFAKIPSNIASTVKVDEYGIPIPPYGINDIWIKDAYDFTQRYDIIKEGETKNLEEFLSAGVWISKVNKLEGEEFNWDDWKKVSIDAGYQLSTIEQDINQIMLSTQKGDLISAINIQAGRILMSSGDADGKSRLMLSKDGTYIDNALIESAHIKDAAITTAKIGDAQIDTAKIADAAITSAKILNLDVLKVSGLTSEFVQSKWNAINSSVTITGNGMMIDGDWGGAINFTRRGQTFYDKIKGQVMGYQYGLYRNPDDPLVNNQMLGVFLGAEMGYDLRLGIRKEIDEQNTTYMAIKSAGGVNTFAEIWGETRLYKGVRTNNQIFYATNDSGSGIKIGAGQALDNWVTTITNAEGTAGIGFTAGGGVMIRRYDSAAGISAWQWL